MCGFAGLIAKTSLEKEQFTKFIKSSELMNHRGPDYRGIFQEDNVLLIHYRLSILDLDKRSNQPFYSKSKNNICVYNGEIYNYKEIANKNQIETITTSDTEVMIETFEKNSFNAIKNWNGIFATAIYDRQKKQIHILRDRLGIKPLYIYENEDVLLFASEAKVILDWLESFEINYKGLSQYMWFGNTTGEQTMIENLIKLKPGTVNTYSTVDGACLNKKEYWSIKNDVKENNLSEAETIDEIKIRLEAAVSRQLISDVPIGVLLSGGIDSSSMVAFASKNYSSKIDTYTVSYDFNTNGKDELQNAKLIAQKFNTNHHELVVTSNNVKEIFCNLVFQYDEPFAEAASIPLYQISKLCAQDKKVILQGDGGDELFAGYRRYNVLNSFNFWKFTSNLYPLIPKKEWKERMRRMAFILNQNTDASIMAYYMSQDVPYKSPYQIFNKEIQVKLENQAWDEDYIKQADNFVNEDKVQKMLKTDGNILLPHTYLEKVDKATMINSIEARVPMLDNDLVDFAFSIPSRLKVKNNEKKYLLKKALEGIIPNQILYGPKNGFNTPISSWLKSDLYDFAKESFENNQNILLDKNKCLAILEAHKKNEKDYSFLLWKILVLNTWLSFYKNKFKLKSSIIL
ncbi:asparagine synthase (glutamine-hydrolyzing) [Flavobacterium ponti]|uniref:asparagine synthase (glutamine-hydrolyzing) n=1 Tax=Flavobacterium ponti TaxID=665133 RepID=A0ABV9P5K2_9FLAO